MKNFKVLNLLFFSFLFFSNSAFALNKPIGKSYCQIRHFVETITSNRVSCESQHIIQQQSSGGDQLNTIWINTTQHDFLDRSTMRQWENGRPVMLLWGSSLLEQAYMMGTYAMGAHYVTYDHHRSGKLTLLHWDGASHLVYLFSNISNFPAKETSYLAYQLSKKYNSQILDACYGVFIDLAEVSIGFHYSLAGVILGSILHPLDTAINLIPALLLVCEAIWEAITNLVFGVFSLLWQLILLVFHVITFGMFK